MLRFETRNILAVGLAFSTALGCGDEGVPAGSFAADAGLAGLDASAAVQPDAHTVGLGITLAADVTPVRSVEQAKPGVFIPPFEDCRDPMPGDVALAPDGKVCTQVIVSACTEPGKYFPDYASCDVVRRQRPYWPADPAAVPDANDARLSDPAYVAELAWVTEQLEASACTCCHDARVSPNGAASQWDIAAEGVWLTTVSDTGMALFTGLADSSVLGAFSAADNHGFQRDVTGVPSTDAARMQAFMLAELAHRGLSEDWARSVPPFGGPIYDQFVKPSAACEAGQGVDEDGVVHWTGGKARYVYVLEAEAHNPGVPPNLDLPPGTLWRLDVLASGDPLASGVAYGTTPSGSFQSFPQSALAPALTPGKTYKLYVLMDMAIPITNCLFEYGKPLPQPVDAGTAAPADAGFVEVDAGTTTGDDAGASTACTLAGGDARGFGAPCDDTVNHTDCPCEANYCAKSPFDARGYCTATVPSCDQTSACPADWSCFDVSVFQAGAPVICSKP